MSEASEEILKFVLLIEQHTDVLLKSQTISNKKKKEEAADLIISKWQTKLTKASLFKKISNLKTRAKSALKNGKRVNEWHTKILGIVNDDNDQDEENLSSSQIRVDTDADSSSVVPNAETNAEQILKEVETDQTKLMSNEQLQRYVLLLNVQVLELQRKRLEYLNNIENGKKVTIDYIGFDDGIIEGVAIPSTNSM